VTTSRAPADAMQENTDHLTLAPAAGSGIGKLLAAALLAKPDLIDSMTAVIERGFNAGKQYWDRENDCWNTEPDCRTQVQTLALVLAHMEGEPIKRVIHQHLGSNGQIDVLGALHDSPALMEAAKNLIAKAEHRNLKPAREEKRVRTAKVEQVGEVVPQSQ
jgi:hypothetical protein